jgi:hypothetical protein
MRRCALLTLTAVSAFCLLPHIASAQDVMVMPDNSGTTPPSSTSWFTPFTPTQPEHKPAEPKESTGTKSEDSAKYPLNMKPGKVADAIAKLPPAIQKQYAVKMKGLAAHQGGHRNADDANEVVDKASKNKHSGAENPNLPPETKVTHKKESALGSTQVKSTKQPRSGAEPLEVTMPELDRAQNDHKFQHKINIALVNEPRFSPEDIRAISEYFSISPSTVEKSCGLKLHSRADAHEGHGDIGEEIKNGKAIAMYDGDLTNLRFEVSARCKLDNPPQHGGVLIKERGDRYLYRLGSTACPAKDDVHNPGSVEAQYLGDGKVTCAY